VADPEILKGGGGAPKRGARPKIAKKPSIMSLKSWVLLTLDGKFWAKGGWGWAPCPFKSATGIHALFFHCLTLSNLWYMERLLTVRQQLWNQKLHVVAYYHHLKNFSQWLLKYRTKSYAKCSRSINALFCMIIALQMICTRDINIRRFQIQYDIFLNVMAIRSQCNKEWLDVRLTLIIL
jgi:hypothetical protein